MNIRFAAVAAGFLAFAPWAPASASSAQAHPVAVSGEYAQFYYERPMRQRRIVEERRVRRFDRADGARCRVVVTRQRLPNGDVVTRRARRCF
jgi:hypothetical protein